MAKIHQDNTRVLLRAGPCGFCSQSGWRTCVCGAVMRSTFLFSDLDEKRQEELRRNTICLRWAWILRPRPYDVKKTQIGRGRGGGRLLLTLAKCQHSFSGVHTGDEISKKLHLCKLYYICIHILIRQTKGGGIWATLLKIQVCIFPGCHPGRLRRVTEYICALVAD